MDFRFYVVTLEGARLIAQATAANPIVITQMCSTSRHVSTVDELAVKTLAWYDGRYAPITAVSATDNVARVVGTYSAEGSRQLVGSVCVAARLASQEDNEAVVLCAKSDPVSTITLPGAQDAGQIAEFVLCVVINASGTVQITPGAAASVADLARFVSIHKAGDISTGDPQTILGQKTFEGKIIANGEVQSHEIQFVTDAVPAAISKVEGITADNTTTTTARTKASAGYGAGVIAECLCTVDSLGPGVNYQGSSQLTVSMAGQTSCGIAFEYNAANYSAQNPHNACLATIYCGNRSCTYNGELFRIRGALQLNDGTNNGTLSIENGLLRASAINCPSLGVDGNAAVRSLTLDGVRTISIDGNSDAVQIDSNFLPEYDEQYDLGDSDKRWDSVFANNLNGRIPRPANDTEEPAVGTIFFAQIVFSSMVTANAKIGAVARVGQGLGGSAAVVDYIRQAAWDSTQNGWQSGGSAANFNTGTYKLLSGLVVTNGSVGFALVMRAA